MTPITTALDRMMAEQEARHAHILADAAQIRREREEEKSQERKAK